MNYFESILSKALGAGLLLLHVALPQEAGASESESSSFTIQFASEAMADSVIAANPGLMFERVIAPAANETIERRHREEGLHLWYKVELTRPAAVGGEVKRLAGAKGVLRVQPAVKIQIGDGNEDAISPVAIPADDCSPASRAAGAATFPNDPLYSRQWHYDHPDRVSINLEKAWEIEKGNPNVIVAVLDSWIDHTHPDLHGNMWVNEAELNGLPDVDDDGNGVVDDIYGYNWLSLNRDDFGSHGTHIAGTIAAVNNNGIGVCGIAGGDGITPGVRIMSEGINTSNDSFVDDWVISRAFVHAADNGAVIASNSWGGSDKLSPIITASINYFIEHAGEWEGSPMKGGLVLFAAGNSGHNHCEFPLNDPELNHDGLVIVGSVGSAGVKSTFSNYGNWVDIMAPGGDSNGRSIFSTVPGGGYGLMNGTSMACPHVTGVAALVVSKFGDGNLTSAQVKQILLSSVRDVYGYNAGHPYKNLLGAGIVDAYRALQSNPETAPASVTGLQVNVTANNDVSLKFVIPADGNGCGVDKCVLYRVGDSAPLMELVTRGLNAGQLYETSFSSGLMIPSGNVFMVAVDRWGHRSQPCEAVEITPYASEIAILNPYATTTFNVFKPADKDFHLSVLSTLDLSFPYHSGNGSVRVSVTDPNGIASAQLNSVSQIELTIAPRDETPVGEYPITVRLENTDDPSEFCEKELTCRVEEGMRTFVIPALKPDCSGHFYVDELKGRFELNLLDILYDPFGLDIFISDDVKADGGFVNSEAWVENKVLYVDYEFDEDMVIWGFDTMIVTIRTYNDYLVPVNIELTLHAPEGAGVENVSADHVVPTSEGIYTLTGVRLDVSADCLPPGIYIINGKKTCIR